MSNIIDLKCPNATTFIRKYNINEVIRHFNKKPIFQHVLIISAILFQDLFLYTRLPLRSELDHCLVGTRQNYSQICSPQSRDRKGQ